MALRIKHSKRVMHDVWEVMPFDRRWKFNQHLVEIIENDTDCGISIREIHEWCDLNLEGMYFNVDTQHYAFELESDMVAFKSRWHGEERK